MYSSLVAAGEGDQTFGSVLSEFGPSLPRFVLGAAELGGGAEPAEVLVADGVAFERERPIARIWKDASSAGLREPRPVRRKMGAGGRGAGEGVECLADSPSARVRHSNGYERLRKISESV